MIDALGQDQDFLTAADAADLVGEQHAVHFLVITDEEFGRDRARGKLDREAGLDE